MSAAKVVDPPDATVALTHVEEEELYCNTCRFAGELIVTSECLEIEGNVPFIVKFPPDVKLNSFVELYKKINVPLEF